MITTRTVPNIMKAFSCDADSAQRYIDLRDEGYGRDQAALMAGLADPPDPDRDGLITDPHAGVLGTAYSTDPELLRQCEASGQMSAAQMVGHGLADTRYAIQGRIANVSFVGIYFYGDGVREQFFRIRCPCGIEASYPVNGLPEVDTPHPCGKADHWSVRWVPGAEDVGAPAVDPGDALKPGHMLTENESRRALERLRACPPLTAGVAVVVGGGSVTATVAQAIAMGLDTGPVIAGVPACPESGKFCNFIDGECQVCGVTRGVVVPREPKENDRG